MSSDGLLVPVSESSTLRGTVNYAITTALENGASRIQFVYIHPPEIDSERDEAISEASELLGRVRVWAREDAGDRSEALEIEAEQIGEGQYVFSPDDIGKILADHARETGYRRVVLDPEYDPGIGAPLLRPLEVELTRFADITVEEAPISRPARRQALLVRSTPLQIGALFGISFLFYQLLGGQFDVFDIVTGALSATIVAIGLSRVTFSTDPTGSTPFRLLRMCVYIPYLLWEILKSNVAVAAVILHPRLPIDPRLTHVRPAIWGGLPLTTLANSITLTPGTLTVRVDGRDLLVHTLIPSAREDLFEGGLERAVRFVFYGREAMRIDSLRNRNVAEVLPADANLRKSFKTRRQNEELDAESRTEESR